MYLLFIHMYPKGSASLANRVVLTPTVQPKCHNDSHLDVYRITRPVVLFRNTHADYVITAGDGPESSSLATTGTSSSVMVKAPGPALSSPRGLELAPPGVSMGSA